MEVGKRITELRTNRGLTTNKLANLCGLSQSFVRSVELGEKGITVEKLSLLCDALDISLRDFFDVPDHVPAKKPLATFRTFASTWSSPLSFPEPDHLDDLSHQISLLSSKQRHMLSEFLKSMQGAK